MAFKSKPAPRYLGEGVKNSDASMESVWDKTSSHYPGEEKDFIGGGWGGWNEEEKSEPASIGIMIGIGRKED
jgi:hypothetical protein